MNGKIIKIISNLYTVEAEGKLYDCRARGRFYHEKLTPLVGDLVKIDDKNNYILKIFERKNYLERPSIANVDKAVIVTSVKKPDLDLNLLDKLLCLIVHNKIEPVICFTKTDLLNYKDKQEIRRIIKYYKKIGFKVFLNKDLRKITKFLAHQTIVLAGQTGAGKSSLLNKLNKNFNIETKPISKALGRGVHTTRHVELLKYKTSLIADTPGFSSLEIDYLTPLELANCFPEFNVRCEFKDCLHKKEKNCKVKSLVEKEKILKSRYENYLKFGD